MRNERASQPGAARPKYRCLAEPTIDEASLLAACRSMARRPRRCADAAIDGLVHDRWLMRRLLAMPARPDSRHRDLAVTATPRFPNRATCSHWSTVEPICW
jgi:hypothetical protein